MSEPLEIVAAIEAALETDTTIALPPDVGRHPPSRSGLLAGKRVVVTSGPTHEPIDPVRYLANRSSGKQGHAIASAAAAAGAQVVLISGPVALRDPQNVATVHVETAREMLAAVENALPADIFIGAAAVADWRAADFEHHKVKKEPGGPPQLHLVENPDILATVAAPGPNRPRLVVGFAAETRDLLDHARQKRVTKHCDLIVANDVSASNDVMGGQRNTVHLVTAAGVESWPTLDKEEVAERLVLRLAQSMGGTSA